MIIESMSIEGVYAIFLALTSTERWKVTGNLFGNGNKGEGGLIIFAVISLIMAVILLFSVFARYKRSEQQLNLKLTDLTVTNVKLRQKNNELTANIEKLQQENSELYRKQEEILENKIDVGTASK